MRPSRAAAQRGLVTVLLLAPWRARGWPRLKKRAPRPAPLKWPRSWRGPRSRELERAASSPGLPHKQALASSPSEARREPQLPRPRGGAARRLAPGASEGPLAAAGLLSGRLAPAGRSRRPRGLAAGARAPPPSALSGQAPRSWVTRAQLAPRGRELGGALARGGERASQPPAQEAGARAACWRRAPARLWRKERAGPELALPTRPRRQLRQRRQARWRRGSCSPSPPRASLPWGS